jgi:NTP pyrophosphatase (non-canonical NTP hydrolase)
MKKLIQDNYDSIVARGLITPSTTNSQFIMKLEEEVQELIDEVRSDSLNPNAPKEMADVILTVLNFAKHHNIDIEKVLKEVVEDNFKRAKF